MLGGFAELDRRAVPWDKNFGRRFVPAERRLRGLSLDARRGFYLAAELQRFEDLGGQGASFSRLTLEAQEFVPIRGGFQVLAFRQLASLSEPDEAGGLPFYLMQELGGTRTLRGFDQGRFRDQNLVLLNTEYRYQVWPLLDLALFVDAGQVFGAFDELRVERVEYGYGFGLRFKTPRWLATRVDFAFSREGFPNHPEDDGTRALDPPRPVLREPPGAGGGIAAPSQVPTDVSSRSAASDAPMHSRAQYTAELPLG